MTNIEQYTNKHRCKRHHTDAHNININIEIPKKASEYLLYDNFLSEYDTEQEKNLVMQNILLLDETPTEGSTKLINSGTVYKVISQLKELINAKGEDIQGCITRQQLEELLNNVLTNYATKQQLNTYATKQDLDIYATKQELSSYATKQELQELIQLINNVQSLNWYEGQ